MSGWCQPMNDTIRKKILLRMGVLKTQPCPSSCIALIEKFAMHPYISDQNTAAPGVEVTARAPHARRSEVQPAAWKSPRRSLSSCSRAESEDDRGVRYQSTENS